MLNYLKRFVRACRLRLLDEWERRYSILRRRWFVASFQWNKMYPADRRQMRAILFLIAVVTALILVVPERGVSLYADTEMNKAILAWEQQQQLDSMAYRDKRQAQFEALRTKYRIADSLRRKNWKRSTFRKTKRPLRFVSFDPNKVDSISLVHMGMPEWMASNMIKYRAAGKLFYKAEELRALYGMTASMYDSIAQYIHIDTLLVRKMSAARTDSNTVMLARTYLKHKTQRVPKLQVGEQIDLNHADTLQFKRIPGVGSAIAKMLVRYREQLGGYASVYQVRDIYLNDTILAKWLTVDQSCVHKVSVNHASLMELKKHPYCTYIQAKAIVDYRKRFGAIRRVEDLQYVPEITSEMTERWKPYLDFTL